MPTPAHAKYTLDAPLSPIANRVVWYEATDDSPDFTADPGDHVSKHPGAGRKKQLVVGRPNALPSGTTVDINIRIVDPFGTELTPLGIALRHTGGGNPGHGNPQGENDFPGVTISGNVLTLTAAAINRGRTYQFDVLFKDSSGNLGMLDPTIMNN